MRNLDLERGRDLYTNQNEILSVPVYLYNLGLYLAFHMTRFHLIINVFDNVNLYVCIRTPPPPPLLSESRAGVLCLFKLCLFACSDVSSMDSTNLSVHDTLDSICPVSVSEPIKENHPVLLDNMKAGLYVIVTFLDPSLALSKKIPPLDSSLVKRLCFLKQMKRIVYTGYTCDNKRGFL